MAQINIIDYNKIVYFDENTGNYKIFDGERWWLSDDKFGTSTKPSNVALVDSAIVDTSVVGEEERPAMQTIWEGSFSGLRNLTEDIQNASLLKDAKEVTVTFDGVVYTATVTKQTSEDVSAYTFGANDPSFSGYPFAFAWTDSRTPVITMIAQTDGEHTIKVEGTPVEPSSEVLYENTFTPESELDSETGDYRYWYDTTVVQNMWKIADKENVKVTLDGTSYICDVNKYEEFDSWDLGDSAFINYPFHLTLTVVSDTETESSSYEMHIYIETGGEHTIKVEGTPSDNEDIPAGDPIEDIGVLPLQPGKDN